MDLDHILSIDKANQFVHVEPSVCIGYLNKFLVREVSFFNLSFAFILKQVLVVKKVILS